MVTQVVLAHALATGACDEDGPAWARVAHGACAPEDAPAPRCHLLSLLRRADDAARRRAADGDLLPAVCIRACFAPDGAARQGLTGLLGALRREHRRERARDAAEGEVDKRDSPVVEALLREARSSEGSRLFPKTATPYRAAERESSSRRRPIRPSAPAERPRRGRGVAATRLRGIRPPRGITRKPRRYASRGFRSRHARFVKRLCRAAAATLSVGAAAPCGAVARAAIEVAEAAAPAERGAASAAAAEAWAGSLRAALAAGDGLDVFAEPLRRALRKASPDHATAWADACRYRRPSGDLARRS